MSTILFVIIGNILTLVILSTVAYFLYKKYLKTDVDAKIIEVKNKVEEINDEFNNLKNFANNVQEKIEEFEKTLNDVKEVLDKINKIF